MKQKGRLPTTRITFFMKLPFSSIKMKLKILPFIPQGYHPSAVMYCIFQYYLPDIINVIIWGNGDDKLT